MKILILLVSIISLQTPIESKKYRFTQVIEQDYPINAVAAISGALVDSLTSRTSIISGYVKFQQLIPNGAIRIDINVSGLIPFTENNHGFHIHFFGINSTSENVTIRCGSCGLHFSTNNYQHGDITFPIRHTGDFGNVIVNQDGVILQQLYDSVSSLDGPNSIIGRTIVLHAKADDKGLNPDPGSKANGNSGARIACGVVGFAQA